ncbi:hypothetical protein QFC19_000749 [Naganishia cerealis]|uniref:Uncharacterized protein n=1 Tax=Naganishia cerealis TaxID=610337 RepID=A0ACC2WKR9_9TREE|nr:hypothetical protein QFC19_000749 [Naganishia cerealis]
MCSSSSFPSHGIDTLRAHASKPPLGTAAGGKGFCVSPSMFEFWKHSQSIARSILMASIAPQATIKALSKVSPRDEATGPKEEAKQEVLQKLQAGSERIKGLKRKVGHYALSIHVVEIAEGYPMLHIVQLEALQPSTATQSPLRVRLDVLSEMQDMSSISDSDQAWLKWRTERVDRFMVDYLLRNGKHAAAAAYAKERNIEGQVDIALFQECARIESALVQKQSCAEALAWCGENRGTLKKTKNYLEFSLRLQEYIELCRKKQQTDALAYAQKYLATWQETHMREIEQAMSLLFFGQGTNVGVYKRLYDLSRWESLRHQFQTTFNSIYGIPSQPILSLVTSAGLSSLKLPACATTLPHESADGVDVVMSTEAGDASQRQGHRTTTTMDPVSSRALMLPIPSLASSPPIHTGGGAAGGMTVVDPSIPITSDASPLHRHPDHPQRNVDCPTCAPYLAVLAKDVPYSHHTNSSLVCRISGEVIDDENYALAFPNGYVYSHKVSSRALHLKGNWSDVS